MNYLLYGANGYTARLIIQEGIKRNHKPILAGRNQEKIQAIAEEYGMLSRIFALNKESEILVNLEGVDFVLNCAGPFEKTALPMVNACIKKGIHYLDITGEIGVFEEVKMKSVEAVKANVMLLPGIGFDVVPTDCMAAYLAEKMSDASHLELAFTSEGSGMSHGTASTAVSQLGGKGYVREKGVLKEVSIAHKSKTLDFGKKKRTVATIPWGDISTAYTSTGIPNIDVYTAMQQSAINFMKVSWLFNPILRSRFVKNLAQRWVDKNLDGPSEEANEKGYALIYGKVSKGEEIYEAKLKCPEVYKFTALAACLIMEKVEGGKWKAGYQTPSSAYGWRLIEEIENCRFY